MNPKSCPNCNSLVPPHAPGGLCPACVLRDANTAATATGDMPPMEDVAAAFPRLEILRPIGHGGMGFVYQARQPDLDRMVALKILSPALRKDPAFEERFSREARVLGKLKHPNIVTLYEHGESGGFFYLLMDFVDGVNLRQAMAAGRFAPEQALAIVPAICDALQAAHAQDVWHRDIKPENILLDRDGGVKIVDFGIARILGDSTRDFTLTRTGGLLGSAPYMAPEQHEKPHSVDHRADIYSLGVVIYEMLTGELPLGRFPLPSQRAEVGRRIDEIVLRTLEKERELRQQSAEEVKTDVRRATRHNPSRSQSKWHSPGGQMPFFWFSIGLVFAAILIRTRLGGTATGSVSRFPLAHAFMHAGIFSSVVCSIIVIYRQRPGMTAVIGGILSCVVVLMIQGIGRGAVDFAIGAAVLHALAAGGAVAITHTGRRVGSVEANRPDLPETRRQWRMNKAAGTSSRPLQWPVLLSVCGLAVAGSGALLLLSASPDGAASVLVTGSGFAVAGCASMIFGVSGLLYLYMMKRACQTSRPPQSGARRLGASAVVLAIASGVVFLIANGFTGRAEAYFLASLPVVFTLGFRAVRQIAGPTRPSGTAPAGGGKDFLYRAVAFGGASVIILGLLVSAYIVAKPVYSSRGIGNAGPIEATVPEIKPVTAMPEPATKPASTSAGDVFRMMNAAANESNLKEWEKFRFPRQEQPGRRSGPSDIQIMGSFVGEVVRAEERPLKPVYDGTPANCVRLLVETKRPDGSHSTREFRYWRSQGLWLFDSVTDPEYVGVCHIEFEPERGDATAILSSHLRANEFVPVKGDPTRFHLIARHNDAREAAKEANDLAAGLRESLKPFSMDSSLRVIREATAPRSYWPDENP